MNVASLELCKELYELTGWGHTDSVMMWRHHMPINLGEVKYRGEVEADNYRFRRSPEALRFRDENKFFPAYDLGYLLRSLPDGFTIVTRFNEGWLASWAETANAPDIAVEAETPEDAVATLILDLFRRGLLGGDQGRPR